MDNRQKIDADRQKIDVDDWRDSPRSAIQTPRKSKPSRRSKRFWPPAVIGIIGTICLHAAFIPSAYLGSRAKQIKPPEIQQAAAVASSGTTEAAEPLVFVALPSTSSPREPPALAPTLLAKLSKVRIKFDPPVLANIELLPLDEDQASSASKQTGDLAEQAHLFGIYSGQIKARIERIWRKPRTPVDGDTSEAASLDDSFQCQVQIVQDSVGNVQEVLTPNCNGSEAWQRSLVVAIQQASPLPAPPSDKVFSRSIALTFVGIPYRPGDADDGYELQSQQIARSVAGAAR